MPNITIFAPTKAKHDMWQCMSDGNIPGISGNVDINFDFAGLEISEQTKRIGSVSMVKTS